MMVWNGIPRTWRGDDFRDFLNDSGVTKKPWCEGRPFLDFPIPPWAGRNPGRGKHSGSSSKVRMFIPLLGSRNGGSRGSPRSQYLTRRRTPAQRSSDLNQNRTWAVVGIALAPCRIQKLRLPESCAGSAWILFEI